MSKIKLQVYIDIDTDKSESDAILAIKTGIYYGLDTKHVCDPTKVISITVI